MKFLIFPPNRPLARKLLLVLAALILTGCSELAKRTFYKEHEAADQDEVGSVHLAVLAVIPWDKAQQSLQPKFPMTPDIALRETAPVTLLLDEQTVQALKNRMSLGFPTAPDLPKPPAPAGKKEDQKQADKDKSKAEQDKKKSPAADQKDKLNTASADKSKDKGDGKTGGGERPESDKPSEKPTSPAQVELRISPMLRYLAATALYQEVSLINTYVESLQSIQGYVPYVVRLQVSLMPRSRNLPYDAYTNISFLLEQAQVPQGPDNDELACRLCDKYRTDAVEACKTRGIPEGSDACWKYFDSNFPTRKAMCEAAKKALGSRGPSVEACDVVASHSRPGPKPEERKTPLVVPLLVTDDIEGAIHSKSAEATQSSALAIAAALKEAGVSVSTEKLEQELRKVAGRDSNSVFTVGRLTDNTLRVRLGASLEPTAGYGMVARTYNISALIFVDSNKKDLSLVSTTRFVHAKTGKEVPYKRTVSSIIDERARIGQRYGLSEYDLSDLHTHVHSNDFAKFMEVLNKTWPGEYGHRFAAAIWAQLLDFQAGSRYSFARLKFPAD